MLTVDDTVLRDPARVAAVDHARRMMSGLRVPMDVIAALVARLFGAPMAVAALVGDEREYILGVHGLPATPAGPGDTSLTRSVGKYVISADCPVRCDDMSGDGDLREHPLVTGRGVRAFLGVPLRDDQDRPVGALMVLSDEVRPWSDNEAVLLAEVAALLPPSLPAPPPAVIATGPLAGVLLPEQDTAAETAERNGRFLATLLDSLSVGVIVCDEYGHVVLINRALREVRGLPPGQPVPPDFAATTGLVLMDADGTPIPWDRTPLIRALRGERVQPADVLVRVPGHRLRTFAATARRITGDDGRPLGAMVIAHEVTAVRRVECFRTCHVAVARALAAASCPQAAAPAVARAVATTLGWPHAELWLIDATGEQMQSIGHWNAPGLDELTEHQVVKGIGITGRVWATGRPLWVPDLAEVTWLRGPEDRARVTTLARRGIRTALSVPILDGDTLLGVITCLAGAPEHHEDLLTVLLDGVATQVGMFVAMRRAVHLTHQLQRARDDFLALVGHELRTPLTSIVANATMLADDAHLMPEEDQQMVRSIERNTAALQRVVDTLLDLAALDADRIDLAVVDVDVADVVARAVAAAEPVAASGNVRIATDLPARLIVDGDPARLRQVVDDLLSNAIKYSPDGGDVLLRLRQGPNRVELSITDEGIGVPPGETDRLFDRFYRATNVRHQGILGSGLGLSRARAIVHLHSGTITITGHQPVGTAVSVRLPLRQRSPRR